MPPIHGLNPELAHVLTGQERSERANRGVPERRYGSHHPSTRLPSRRSAHDRRVEVQSGGEHTARVGCLPEGIGPEQLRRTATRYLPRRVARPNYLQSRESDPLKWERTVKHDLWRRLLPVTLTGLLVLAAPDAVPAQGTQETRERPEARPEDVQSPDAVVGAVYEAISGDAGEERDWDRLRSLFLPEGRLIPSGRGPEGEASYRVLSVDEYIEGASEAFAKEPFYEREINAVTERFGDIAHVFSTYESRRSPDADPFQRGINSFQLWHDGQRWWIVDVFWHAEREGAPIPERYGGE